MAKREKRKTSLGNALDSSTKKHEAPQLTRWRSASESNSQIARPKLFRSVREAMEFEAAEEEAQRQARSEELITPILDARTLNTLEQTQADQAGYTIIRRRAISEPEQRISTGADRNFEATKKRGKSSRERRHDPSEPVSTSIRRYSKRSPNSAKATTSTAWSSINPESTDLVGSDMDAQRWLAAASAGDVLPATTTSGILVASSIAVSTWQSTQTSTATTASSSQTAVALDASLMPSALMPSVHPQVSGNASTTLDESMLSWLENALALDETCASSSKTDPEVALEDPLGNI